MTKTATSVRGRVHQSFPNIRNIVRYRNTHKCNLSGLMFAVGVNNDRLLSGTSFEQPFGQSQFAFQRGKTFEKMLAGGDYEPYRDHFQLPAPPHFVARDLRVGFARRRSALPKRALETRRQIEACLRGEDPFDLMEGAVFEHPMGHEVAYFEADALVHKEGRLFVCEVKSFPKLDGKIDEDKLGAALDQVAAYVMLVQDLVEALGFEGRRVSSSAYIITPHNTGLRPSFERVEVAGRCRRARHLFEQLPDLNEHLARVPDGASFGPVGDGARPVGERLKHLESLADAVGTAYTPSCLSNCGNALFCRSRTFECSDAALVGPAMTRLLPGCSLTRAAALSEGASPRRDEEPLAELLRNAGQVYDQLINLGGQS